MTYAEVLREKRQAVLSEIERLRAEQAAIASQLATKESQVHNIDQLLALEGGSPSSGRGRPTGTPTSLKSTRFIEAAWETLRSHGKPVHYRILAQDLSAKGIYVPGQDPAANLLAHMSRDPRFERAEGRGVYRLAESPVGIGKVRAPRRVRWW